MAEVGITGRFGDRHHHPVVGPPDTGPIWPAQNAGDWPWQSSALKTKGLVLVNAEVAGWKRIVEIKNLASVAPTGEAADAIEALGRGTAIDQVFVL